MARSVSSKGLCGNQERDGTFVATLLLSRLVRSPFAPPPGPRSLLLLPNSHSLSLQRTGTNSGSFPLRSPRERVGC